MLRRISDFTVGLLKLCTIPLSSSMKCQITCTRECCFEMAWSQTGHSFPMLTLLGLAICSRLLSSTNSSSQRNSSSLECTNAMWRATFCGFSPLYKKSFVGVLLQGRFVILSHLPESTFWACLLVRQLLYDLHQFLHKMPGDVLARGIFQIAYDALGTNRDLRTNNKLIS